MNGTRKSRTIRDPTQVTTTSLQNIPMKTPSKSEMTLYESIIDLHFFQVNAVTSLVSIVVHIYGESIPKFIVNDITTCSIL